MKRTWVWLILILLLGFGVRSLDIINARAIEMDGVWYAQIAERFANGAFSEALRSIFPPFYPLVIALFHLVIPDLEMAGRLVSLACGLLLICGSYLALRRFLGAKKALWGAFFIAIHPYLARYSAQVLSDSLATLLFAATIFCFYVGYTEKSGWRIALSGFLLTLTYLTRPEYIVYYVPLAAFLLYRRRLSHTAALLVSFIVLGLSYIVIMRVETGLWIVSGKAIQSPFVPFLAASINVPVVSFHLFAALFPPFMLLLIPGFTRVERPYRSLVIALSIFHVLSLACVGHSTRRYSLEFVPLLLVFAVEGWQVVRAYAERFKHGRALWLSAAALIALLALSQGIESPNEGRGLFKRAGLFLLHHDRGAKIASRLPLPSFYDKGTWVNGPSCASLGECPRFVRHLETQGAKYFVLDDEMISECPWLGGCVASFPLVANFSNREGFVKIYWVPSSALMQR
jgi:4-amino-4-deoxy-L-arabinose transferase-like glycosyltransferase